MRTTSLLFLFYNLFQISAKAQDIGLLEDSLALSYKTLSEASSDNQRIIACNEMRSYFMSAFKNPESFSYPFEKLKLGKITSSDNHIRLINWNMPLDDGAFKYFCFVLVKNAETSEVNYTELTDFINEGDKIETRFLNPNKWLGALYYEVIPMPEKRKQQASNYVLLGWDGKDNLTTRKVLEVLSINGNSIRLGAPIFEMENGTQKRVILEYSDEVSASLKYFPKKKSIVMDHLSPKSSATKGIYADYGPDGTYDLLKLEKNKWKLISNIDVSQFANDNDRPYVDPRKTK